MDHSAVWALFRFFGVLIFFVGTASSCDHWNQPIDKLTAIDHMTTKQLAEKGETLIFGGIGKSGNTGNIGKAQCPVCHAFKPEHPSKRAPNLWGTATRQRIKPTSIEYLAESHVCPSCYVVADWGLKGSQGCESPMPKVHLPPINLTLEELVAIDTWMYVHEGEPPPSPRVIRTTYKDILSKEEWRYVTRDTQIKNSAESSVKQLFLHHACAGCHMIPGIPGATGRLGPPLYMKITASERLKEPTYQGRASSPREYIAESILYHDIYVVDDNSMYAKNTLPSSHYRNKINTADLLHMVDYLAQLEKGGKTQLPDKTGVEKCLQNKGL